MVNDVTPSAYEAYMNEMYLYLSYRLDVVKFTFLDPTVEFLWVT